ncbi:MAG: hypothetical protein IPL79_13775 [Myxococcales bacterium]|nr:hypothetical protein [Myxococcales bacterium]
MNQRQLLVAQGSLLLYKEGARLLFCDRGSQATTARFVSGLLAAILLANGIAQVALHNLVVGLPLLAVGGLCALTFLALGKARRKRNTVADVPPVLVLDLGQGLLLDGTGRTLAPLTDVTFASAFQFTSSARALDVRYGTQTHRLFAGNGLAGHSPGPFLDALRAYCPAVVAR